MRALAAIALALVACAGGGAAKKQVVAAKLGPPVDEKKAEKDASGLVGEVYETIGRGDTKDGMFPLLSDRLVVIGPRKLDAFATRSDALEALGTLIDPRDKKKTPMRSNAIGSLAVIASPGGRSALAFDVVNANGEQLAATAILTNYDDLWTVEAVSIARMPAHAAVAQERTRDGIVPPGAGMKAKVVESPNGPPVKAAIDKFQRGLLDQQVWGDDLSDRDDAIVVGPEAGEIARGKEIKRLWRKRLDGKLREAVSGEITAEATVDGQLAWVSAPVTRVVDGEDPLPLRAFAVFQKDGTSWRMVALHESLAIDAPGSGTAWKKVVPPKPPEPKAEPKVEVVAKVAPKEEPKKTAKLEETPKKKAKKAEPVEEAPKKKVKKADPVEETPKKKKKKVDDSADDAPKKKVKKADPVEETPKKKRKKSDDDAADEAPKKKKKFKKADDAADETPKKKRKKVEDDVDEAPKKKKKMKKSDDADDETPKKKKKSDDADDDQPKKKKKHKKSDDEDVKISDD